VLGNWSRIDVKGGLDIHWLMEKNLNNAVSIGGCCIVRNLK